MTRRRGARTGRFGVRSRLLAIVVVPLVLLTVLVGQQADDKRTIASAARRTDASVALLHRFVQLDRALYEEIGELVVRQNMALLSGVDVKKAAAAAGVQVSDDPAPKRATTDQRLARLPLRLRPFSMASLTSARREIDDGRTTALASKRFDALRVRTAAALQRQLRIVRGYSDALGDVDLERSVAALTTSFEASGAASQEITDFANMVLVPESNRLRYVVALAVDADRKEQARNTSSAPLSAPRASARSQGERFDRAVSEVLAGTSIEALAGRGRNDLAEVLAGGALYSLAVGTLPLAAGDAVRATASHFAAVETSDAKKSSLIAAFSVLVSLIAAGWFARSISAPVRRFTNQARRVGNGELDLEPLSPAGPREIVLASSAFNDVVANLRLLERKTRALAACNLSDPSLREHLPGRLGEALNRSVEVFSGSIAQQDELQSRLAHQATHDMLTGLPNRAAAVEAIDRGAARCRRTGRVLAVISIDLDDFKHVNDFLGQAVGDGVLSEVGRRLEGASRRGEVVARLGSDEFLMIAEGVDDATEAIALARRAVDVLGAEFVVEGHAVSIEASAGIALDQDDRDDAHVLLSKAGLAVQRAKQHSESSVELYDEQLQRQFLQQADVQSALSATLARGGDELRVHYQPIVDARGGHVVALEALVRWNRDGHELIQPDDFIPIAELSNLIIDLDRWVLFTAMQQFAEWRDVPALSGVHLAVNVSGRHVLHADLAANITEALLRSGIAPDRLVVEVTETVLLADVARAARQLDAIRQLGVRIAVDDFGTGYTSLTHLRALPIDEIKIDRSFVSELSNSKDRILIEIVNNLAHQLGVPTIAEGVEDEREAEILAELGCDSLQGYLFSRPLDARALVAWATARADSLSAGIV